MDTEETKKIEEIVERALKIKDNQKRESYILEQCGDNFNIIEIVRKDINYFEEKDRYYIADELDIIGEEINNYIILEKLNSGGFASVYRAEHKVLNSFAAIKIYKIDFISNEDVLRAWKNELKSLSSFDHDNIVKFYDGGVFEKNNVKYPYIVEELIQGLHIDRYCKKRDLTIREILRFFITLCNAIEYIHDENKPHLDIKPNNIFITLNRPPRVKVVDFGSSKLLKNKQRPTKSDFYKPVTLLFAAPEQLDNFDLPDKQTDVYSLGVLIYLLLTEKYPFGNENCSRAELIEEVTNVNTKPILPSERILENQDIEKNGHSVKRHSRIFKGDLDAIIRKSLEKRRKKRYQSVREFRQDLENFLDEKPVNARKKNFSYYLTRGFSRAFRIKRERFGWDKWKTPFLRFCVILIVILLFLFFARQYFTSPVLTLVTTKTSLRTRVSDDKSESRDYKVLNLKFDGDSNFTFLRIPKGTFQMGKRDSEKFGSEEEELQSLPVHKVEILDNFYMGKFEVTRKQWNLVVGLPKKNEELNKFEPSNLSDSLPATDISYNEANEFCVRLSNALNQRYKEDLGDKRIIVRLPSEAEWEYSCRAGTENKFGISDKLIKDAINVFVPFEEEKWKESPEWAKDFKTKLSFMKNDLLGSSKFDGNLFGLTAMNGNVWEMTSDNWSKNHEFLERDTQYFVIRGGAYIRDAFMAQCSYRTNATITSTGNDQLGFRIVIEGDAIDKLFSNETSPSK